MADKYTIDVITDIEKKQLAQIAETAIANLRRKIAEIKQMIVDEKGMQTFNKPYEVAYYIKEAIGIPNRQVQDDNNIDDTNGAENESYYIRFIPINKQNIVVDLRTSDHIRGEEWGDRKDGSAHPNLRAGAIVQDTEETTPKVNKQKPHEVNGCKVKRVVQTIPVKIYGTPEQAIKHLNTLICLFQNGYFGKYKNKNNKNTTIKHKKEERYMRKNTLIIKESQLRNIVKESVRRILRENDVLDNEEGWDEKYNKFSDEVFDHLYQVYDLIENAKKEFGEDAINEDDFICEIQPFLDNLNDAVYGGGFK